METTIDFQPNSSFTGFRGYRGCSLRAPKLLAKRRAETTATRARSSLKVTKNNIAFDWHTGATFKAVYSFIALAAKKLVSYRRWGRPYWRVLVLNLVSYRRWRRPY
jgi:hypothetical protein